jgi:hypothetical protein
MRAMSIEALCVYIGIGVSTFKDYHARADFSAVTTRVKEIIHSYNFEGAAGGLLKENIVARKLELKDHTDHTTKGQPINVNFIEKND